MGRYNYYCPATANTMSKMANGTCDNLLLATYHLQSVLFILLRNGFRYVQASPTIATFKALHEFGNTIIPAESGELASGLSGEEWQNLQLFLVF
jgi:phosphopantothenoylcysteine decarboxylase/phosphopantothenate--cysteine ligase